MGRGRGFPLRRLPEGRSRKEEAGRGGGRPASPGELRAVGPPVKRFRSGWYGVLVSARSLATATTEAASAGSSDEDVVDSGGYDADDELGDATTSSSSSSHSASISELLPSNDGSAGDSTQLKRRRYVEETWFEAGASPSAARRGVVVGRGKSRLVAVDEGDPGRELPVGAVKRFHGGWYGVLVSLRPISTTTEASSGEAVNSGGYYADAESGASSSLAEAGEEEAEAGREDTGGR